MDIQAWYFIYTRLIEGSYFIFGWLTEAIKTGCDCLHKLFCYECLLAYILGFALIFGSFIYRRRSTHVQHRFFGNRQGRPTVPTRTPCKRRPGCKFREKEIRIAIINRLKQVDPHLFQNLNVALEFDKDGAIRCVPKEKLKV